MARQKRTDYPGAFHHVMNRGARREAIFHKDSHCILFLEVLEEAVLKRGAEVHAYALMPNHFHLLVCSANGNLSRFMQDVGGNYSRRLNRIHSWDGPLFRGRFKSQLIEDDSHLMELVSYLHLNPVRANLVREPQEDCWTSHQAYIGLDKRPSWLTLETITAMFGGSRELHDAVMAHHRGSAPWPGGMDLATGWSQIQANRPAGVCGLDLEPPESLGTFETEHVISAVVAVTGKDEAELRVARRGRGGNPVRRLAVLALSRWTQSTQREIGARLGISSGQVALIVHRFRKDPGEPLRTWLNAIGKNM